MDILGHLGTLLCHLAAASVFVLLKLFYSQAQTGDFLFFLKPASSLLALITGASAVWLPQGYYFQQLDLVIDQSCSGFNFFSLAFLLLYFLLQKFVTRPFQKFSAIFLSLLAAWFLAIVANAFRILASVTLQNLGQGWLPAGADPLVHELAGITTYLGFLIMVYYSLDKILSARQNHAKPA